MFPIAIIAGVIGAAVSTAQGASWLQDHVGSSGDASSVGGKTGATTQTNASASPSFEATLAAQSTGQSVPATTATKTATTSGTTLVQHTTSYDTLERTKAGIAAYGRVGEHRNSGPVTQS